MVFIIPNWLGREGLQFMQALNDEEQEKCKASMGLSEVLCEKFKLQNNDTMLSLQYCKLIRQQNENGEEWMGHLRIKAGEFKCKKD